MSAARPTAADAAAAVDARRAESGAVLVLFALLLVGLFGLLGVVVDGGRLRVTRQQLDAGAEAIALEGLRFKDTEGDVGRRDRALTMADWQWDDDLDPGNGDRLGLGAGTRPVVLGGDPLGGQIVVAGSAAARAWKPGARMQANLANTVHGDLVAGQHVPGAEPFEDDAFARTDFVPAAVGSAASVLQAAPALLVRLRRATSRLALDRQPGESSAGPPFEWLWARGSAWQEPGPSGTVQSRADGLTLRATAIAATERALVVASVPNGGPVVAPFALRADAAAAWNGTAVGAPLALAIETSGLLTVAGNEEGLALAQVLTAVGQTVAAPAPTLAAVPATALLVAVYGTVNGDRRIIGFTLATASVGATTLTVVRLPGAVLPAGASSVSPSALDSRVALELDPVLRSLHAAFSEPVSAPVLRR